MSEFNLRVVTPHGLFFDGKAESLKVRTTETLYPSFPSGRGR